MAAFLEVKKVSNMRDVNKRLVGIGLRIELLKKVEKRAKKNRRTTSGEIASMLDDATRDVVLTSSDYDDIAKEVRDNEKKRKA